MNCEQPMEEKNADCTKNLLNAAESKRRILQELQDLVTQHKNGSPYCKAALVEVQAHLEAALHSVETHVRSPLTPFKSAPTEKSSFLLAGHPVSFAMLGAQQAVLETLQRNGASFAGLEPIRTQYEKCFGDDLCWTFPYCDGKHLGGVILPVKEGFLYLPYDGLSSEDYELFTLTDAALLTEEQVRFMATEVEEHSQALYQVLLDIYPHVPSAGD